MAAKTSHMQCESSHNFPTENEPRREKTGLPGFQPGPTQTGLYSYRRRLET